MLPEARTDLRRRASASASVAPVRQRPVAQTVTRAVWQV